MSTLSLLLEIASEDFRMMWRVLKDEGCVAPKMARPGRLAGYLLLGPH